MRGRLGVTAFSLIAMAGFGAARAQNRLPNATDLRAAYCIAVLQNFKSMANATLSRLKTSKAAADAPASVKAAREKALQSAKEALAAAQASLKKIQLYLLPRMMRLDPTGLVAASTAAKDDMRRFSKAFDSCSDACFYNMASYEKCLKVCVRKKMPDMSGLRKKWHGCRDPVWLPF